MFHPNPTNALEFRTDLESTPPREIRGENIRKSVNQFDLHAPSLRQRTPERNRGLLFMPLLSDPGYPAWQMSRAYLRREYVSAPEDFCHRLSAVFRPENHHLSHATTPSWVMDIVRDIIEPTEAEGPFLCEVASEWVTEWEFERIQAAELQEAAGITSPRAAAMPNLPWKPAE